MKSSLTRRAFLSGATAVGAAAAFAGMTGCAPQQNEQPLSETGEGSSAGPVTIDQLAPADMTENADVVVVGAAGVSGMVAALHAIDCGLNVIPIDVAGDFSESNSSRYGGVFALETPERLAMPAHVTKQAFFEKYFEVSNGQGSMAVVRNMIVNSAETAELVKSAHDGFYSFAPEDPVTELIPDISIYASYTVDCWQDDIIGPARAPFLEKQYTDRGKAVQFNCEATDLLYDGEKVVGVRYTNAEGKTVDAMAPNVVVACGGCAFGPDIFAELSGGAETVGAGCETAKGDGIRMCLAVGAAKGKNFTMDMVEFGGANPKASPSFSYIGTEGPLTLMLAAGLFVGQDGRRFMPEQTLVNRGAMFCADAIMRQKRYYVVIDSETVKRYETTPFIEAMGAAAAGLNPGMDMIWSELVLSNLGADLETGVDQGWVFKGETLEELAEAMGAPELVNTVEAYNGYCDTGLDLQFYKDASLMEKVATPPFYAIENVAATFNTMNGIQVDSLCRAIRPDGSVIGGLFVVGSDAELWGTQYSYGNTCQGFESMSGYLAADVIAGNEVKYEA